MTITMTITLAVGFGVRLLTAQNLPRSNLQIIFVQTPIVYNFYYGYVKYCYSICCIDLRLDVFQQRSRNPPLAGLFLGKLLGEKARNGNVLALFPWPLNSKYVLLVNCDTMCVKRMVIVIQVSQALFSLQLWAYFRVFP